MLNVIGLDIEINKGNAAGLTFHFEGEDIPVDGTMVVFQVKKLPSFEHSVIEKELMVDDGAIELDILPEDTESIPFGNYYWNACIQFSDGLEPWTLMRDWALFRVLPG